ncbi:MAG: anti-sigma factor family protein [Blastocatellia bacterium]
MNCNDFELKITDLARGYLSEAGARERAIAHAAECRRCAARLRDEQRLTAGLRELAATFADEQMPLQREAQLLAAFRAEHRTASPIKRTRRYLGWAAAAVIVLVALAAARFIESRKSQMLAAESATQQQETSLPDRGATPEQNATTSSINDTPLSIEQASRLHRHAPHASASAPHKLTSKAPRNATMAVTQPPATEPVTSADDEPPSEIATSFIALDGGRGLARPESLQMVRVELPRSALVSFGLPMNVERADERIKADLLVGDDGVARAIRFVR